MGGAQEHFLARSAGNPIVLRSADPLSRRYITGLPSTLDALLLKARSLFPVPPGNTPYITLDEDDQTVILEDALPFLREREVLVFRWNPETPRRAHGKSVKWDSSVANAIKAAGSSAPADSTSRRSKVIGSSDETGSSTSSPAATVATSGRGPSTSSPSSSTSRCQTQLTQAQQHRAAHARRVLEEQKRIQEEEAAEAASQRVEEELQAEERRRIGEAEAAAKVREVHVEKDSEEKAADEAAKATAAEQATTQAQAPIQPPQQQNPSAHEHLFIQTPIRQQDTAATASNDLITLSPTDLAVSGSSPPPYSSPRKPAAREVTPPTNEGDANNVQSSPLVASPTREVHAAVAKASMSPHGDRLVAGRSPVSSRCVEEDVQKEEAVVQDVVINEAAASTEDGSLTFPKDDLDATMTPSLTEETLTGHDCQAEAHMERGTETRPPSRASPSRYEKETDTVYKIMRSVIENLRNHPGNIAFRDPMPLDYTSFAESHPDRRGAIDLYIILSRITTRMYGTIGATPNPLDAFTSDLKRMWSLARAFYGSSSPQAQCASVLNKFAEVFMAEWKLRPTQSINSTPKALDGRDAADGEKRVSTIAGRSTRSGRNGVAADEKEEARKKAAALMASWNSSIGATSALASPVARGEKRSLNGGEEDVSASRLTTAGNRLLPFQRRPAKQQRTGSYTGEKAVDMMAFHRAMMGETAPPVASVAITASTVGVTETASRPEQEQVSVLEQQKENKVPDCATSESLSDVSLFQEKQDRMQSAESIPASTEATVQEEEPETTERSVSDTVESSFSLSSTSSISSSLISSGISEKEEASSSTDLPAKSITLPSAVPATIALATTRSRRRRNPARSSMAGVSDSPQPLVSKSRKNKRYENDREGTPPTTTTDSTTSILAVPVPAAADSEDEEIRRVEDIREGGASSNILQADDEQIVGLAEAVISVEDDEKSTNVRSIGTIEDEVVDASMVVEGEEEAPPLPSPSTTTLAAATAAAAADSESTHHHLPDPSRRVIAKRSRRSLGPLQPR